MSQKPVIPPRSARSYWVPGISSMIIVAGAALLIGIALFNYEKKHFQRTFALGMSAVMRDMSDMSYAYLSRLNAVAAVFAASEVVDADEFERFQSIMGQWPRALRGVMWAPRVTADQRAHFEAALAAIDPVAAKRGIFALDERARAVRQGPAAVYYPLLYSWGSGLASTFRGFDFASAAQHMALIEAASGTGTPAFSMYQGPLIAGAEIMQSWVPVYKHAGGLSAAGAAKEELLGFVVGIADLRAWLGKVMANAADDIHGLRIWQHDLTSDAVVRQYAATRQDGGVLVEIGPVTDAARAAVQKDAILPPRNLDMGRGRWSIIALPHPLWYVNALVRAFIAAGSLFALCLMFLSILRYILNNKQMLVAHVEERTQSLREANENLQIQREELIQLTCELAEAKERAEGAMKTRSNFMAMMSHEIRTPISGVVGMADLLAQTPLSREQHGYVATIRQSGDILLAMINDILDSMRLEARQLALARESFHIAGVIEGVADLLRPRIAAKGLTLDVVTEFGGDDRVVGDPIRLRQVLLNLLGNAAKFTEKGGIALEARVQARTGAHVDIYFAVTDTGIGIPPDRLDSVFEKFTQVGGSRQQIAEGSGLGLAIARELVDLMGGRICVTSRLGEGSRFYFTARFAAADENATAAAMAEPPPPSPQPDRAVAAKPLSVLLVEDNAINIKLLSAVLERAGHDVTVAQDGAAALAATVRKHFDAILMDMHMPKMDGFEATRRIRALGGEYAQLPILAVTANALDGDRERCLDAGATDYFQKPINFERLCSRLAELAAAKQAHNRAAG